MADIYPESRVEEILIAMINGEEYTKFPESRIEALLIELLGKIIEVEGRGAYEFKGSVDFDELPDTLTEDMAGWTYNMAESFVTDERFVDGSGKTYPQGTNVSVANVGTDEEPNMMFDVPSAFVDVSDIYNKIHTVVDDIADEFDEDSAYEEGDLVIYENVLYKFVSDHTASDPWYPLEVEAVTVSDLIAAIYTALSGKQDALTFDDAPTASSDNPVKSGGVYTALSGKQDALTFDDAPIASSNNPVKSGGVYTALSSKQDNLSATKDANNDVTFNGNVIDGAGNVLSEVSALEVSASGNPIIVNAQPVDAKELSVELEPIQDLHGYDHPWAGGAGKNKLPMTVDRIKAINVTGSWSGNAYTVKGITYTLITDDGGNIIGIKANGTSTDSAQLYILLHDSFLAGSYKLNGFNSSIAQSSDSYLRFYNYNDTSRATADTNNPDVSFTLSETADAAVWISIANGVTVNNVMFNPMIRLASVSDATFAPYSNICPISGRTGTSVNDHGKNLVEDTLASASITSAGVIQTTSESYDIQIAKVKSGKTYTITSNELFVGGFFTEKPVVGSTTYNGSRMADTPRTFTAPIDGYVAFRTRGGYSTPQCELGSVATAYEPYKSSSVTLSFGQTVYGGQVDFKTGRVRVTHKGVDMGDLTWNYDAGTTRFYSGIISDIDAPSGDVVADVITEQFKATYASGQPAREDGTIAISVGGAVWVYNTGSGTDKNAFASLVDGHMMVYKLATPTELTLTPQALELLKGYNYITGDGEMSMVYIPESIFDEAKAYTDSVSSGKVDNSVVGTVENGTTASKAYAVGAHFVRNDKFCTAIASIAQGATFTLNTNYVEGDIDSAITELANTNIYSADEVKVGKWLGQDLYRKVVDLGTLPNNNTISVASGLTNVTIRKIESYEYSSNIIAAIPRLNISENNVQLDRAYYTYDDNKINFQANRDASGYTGYVILEYTKNPTP